MLVSKSKHFMQSLALPVALTVCQPSGCRVDSSTGHVLDGAIGACIKLIVLGKRQLNVQGPALIGCASAGIDRNQTSTSIPYTASKQSYGTNDHVCIGRATFPQSCKHHFVCKSTGNPSLDPACKLFLTHQWHMIGESIDTSEIRRELAKE